jgi:low temperature requirement protein LtrA
MDDRRAERGQRVTPLELFFDLVVVFAITQVTSLLSDDPTWGGLLRGLLLLGSLWWAWSAYAWLTNTLDPEEGAVRLAMLAAIGGMLIVSLAAPEAFGRHGVVFGVAYLVVRSLHLVLFSSPDAATATCCVPSPGSPQARSSARACWSWPASSMVGCNLPSGASRWPSTTSAPSWGTCGDGA